MTIKFDPSGFLTVGLTLIFAAAKVFGFINWPWLWVLCPLWIPFCILLAIAACIALWFFACFVVAVITTRWVS